MAFVVGQVSATVTANTAGFSAGMNKVKAEGTASVNAVEKANATAMSNVSKAGQSASQSLITSFQKAGKSMQTVGKGMTKYLTLPLLAVGVGAFKMGKDFEKEMQKVVGLVGIAQEQVDAWGQDIMKMGPELGVAPRELAEGLFFVTSAGLRGAEAMDVLRTSAKASMVGLGETKVVADTLTSAINAYGSANLSATQAADILTAAVREGKLEADALAPVMGNLLPMASAMSISFAQVSGSLAVMSRVGADAATSATSLNAIMMFLQKPTKEAKEVLDSVGLSMQDLRDMAKKEPDGLLQVMRLLDETFGDNEEAMAQIIPNIRALRGVMNMLSQDADVVDSIMNNVTNSTGMLEGAVAANADTVEFKWKKALADMQVTLLALFDVIKDSVAPMLEGLSEKFKDVTNWIQGLDEGQKKMLVSLAGIAIVGGPVLIVLGKLTTAITTLIPLAMALFASPIGIALGLIAVVGLASVAIINLGKDMMETTGKIELQLNKQVGMFGLSTQEMYQVQKDNVLKKQGLLDEELKAEQEKYDNIDTLARESMVEQLDIAKKKLKGLKKEAQEELASLNETHQAKLSKINEEYGVATGLSKSKLDIITENYQKEADEAKKAHELILESAEKTYKETAEAATIAYEGASDAIKVSYDIAVQEATAAYDVIMGLLDKQLAREEGLINRELDMTIGGYEDKLALLEGASEEEIAQRKKTRETARAIDLEDLIANETDSKEKQKLIDEREALIQGIISSSADTQQETSKWSIRESILDAKEEAAEKKREAEETTTKLKEESEKQLADKIADLESRRDNELETLTNLYNDELKLLDETRLKELEILNQGQADKLQLIEDRKIAAMTANEAIRQSLEDNEKASFEASKDSLQAMIDYYNDDWMNDRRAQLQTELDEFTTKEKEKTQVVIDEIAARKVALDDELTRIDEDNAKVIKGIYDDLKDIDYNKAMQEGVDNFINGKTVVGGNTWSGILGVPGNVSDVGKDKKDTPEIVGSYAVGTPYVPKTGLAMVHEGEQIIPAGQNNNSGNITMNITQNITDKVTAEYANDYLLKKIQGRGLAGAWR